MPDNNEIINDNVLGFRIGQNLRTDVGHLGESEFGRTRVDELLGDFPDRHVVLGHPFVHRSVALLEIPAEGGGGLNIRIQV